MYLLYVMYRWVHMCLILMCQYYKVITILRYCITITYYSRVKNHVFLQKILLLCWCHFQKFIFLHDTKKIYFSFRGFPVQSITWFASSLCIHIWWRERGQNSRKNCRRGETEHKCININFSLKVFWRNLNDIDLLNFAKRIFYLLFVIVGDVGKIFSSLSINLIRKSRMVRI